MIISNEQFSEELGAYSSRCKNVADGKKSENKTMKAIAEVISEIGGRIDSIKTDGKSQKTNVNLDDSEMQSVYRKIVSLLTK